MAKDKPQMAAKKAVVIAFQITEEFEKVVDRVTKEWPDLPLAEILGAIETVKLRVMCKRLDEAAEAIAECKEAAEKLQEQIDGDDDEGEDGPA